MRDCFMNFVNRKGKRFLMVKQNAGHLNFSLDFLQRGKWFLANREELLHCLSNYLYFACIYIVTGGNQRLESWDIMSYHLEIQTIVIFIAVSLDKGSPT